MIPTNSTGANTRIWPAIISVIAGLLLIFLPKLSAFASMGIMSILAWFLSVIAFLQIMLLVFIREKKDISTRAVSIILFGVGLYFLFNPDSAASLMTRIFAVVIFLSGISNIMLSFSIQGNMRMVLMINGIVGILFARMIWANWPYSGVEFIGILLGLHLLMGGMTKLMYKN